MRCLTWRARITSSGLMQIGGFDLLAAILKPKMSSIMDGECARIVLSILGINLEKPG